MIEKNLPKKIAIFPLSSAIFFPRTVLPLNIFEKRYIELVKDCMKDQRLFGMVQPKFKKKIINEVYDIGCLGKIISFDETSDKRFIITLSGISRFKIMEELETNKLYREFKVDYSDFAEDLEITKNENIKIINNDIIKKIKIFFKKIGYLIEFDKLEKLNFDQMISTICMIAPFSSEEKQKLVEAIKIEDKIKVLEEIIDFNLVANSTTRTIQ